jgi:hypothetical protein
MSVSPWLAISPRRDRSLAARVDSRPLARLRSPAVAPRRGGARSGSLRPGSRAVAGEDQLTLPPLKRSSRF